MIQDDSQSYSPGRSGDLPHENMQEVFRRRRLPHWDIPGVTYFITTCLKDSIPAHGLLEIEQYRRVLAKRRRPESIEKDEWQRRQWKQLFAEFDRWLDNHSAVHHLADERLAKIVVDSLYHFAGQRYELWAFVVMSSHIHWVFTPLQSYEEEIAKHSKFRSAREAILKSFNGFTSRQCNEMLGTSGPFWQDESYDHWIRDDDELGRVIDYVEGNPVKAGLVKSKDQWLYSSAHDRIALRVTAGPLVRL